MLLIKSTLLTLLSLSLATAQFSPLDLLNDFKVVYSETFLTRRGLTSDWHKFVFGFQRGGTKVQTRLSQNCYTDGIALVTGLQQVAFNYFKTKDMDVFYNADDIFMSFNTKCNLIDTIEGTIMLNFLANHLISID